MLAAPSTDTADNSQGLVSYEKPLGDTLLWDNIDTDAQEGRDTVIAQAFIDARAALQVRLGSDENQWLWGKLHTVTFTTLIPASGLDVQSIPSASDPQFANGFPRHSDWGAIDVGNFSLWNAAATTNAGSRHEKLWRRASASKISPTAAAPCRSVSSSRCCPTGPVVACQRDPWRSVG